MYVNPVIDVIVDLQFGSTGKGALAGYLGYKNRYDTVISVNGPNAGHTFWPHDQCKIVNKILPSAAHTPYCERVLIGPGAVFDYDQLRREIDVLRSLEFRPRVIVHENAWLMDSTEYRRMEKDVQIALGSTGAGMGAAAIAKIARGNGYEDRRVVNFKKDIERTGAYMVNHRDWVYLLMAGRRTLLEGSQGYSLSMNGAFYPYCTTRDCTVARLCADAMVPWSKINTVWGSMRLFPIRVAGNSGGWYPDQIEITWDDLEVDPEFTTVTNKMRRVATFSKEQVREALFMNGVEKVFLNFCNYDYAKAGEIATWISDCHPEVEIAAFGHGPLLSDIRGTLI